MAITVTYRGPGGITDNGTTQASLALGQQNQGSPGAGYNQTAGHLIVVMTNTSGTSLTSVTDTAGNTYTPLIASPGFECGASTGRYINCHYKANCAGNAANVIQANYSPNTAYSTIAAWDVTGVDTPDVSVTKSVANPGGNGPAPSNPFTTVAANEAIFTQWAATAAFASGPIHITNASPWGTDEDIFLPSNTFSLTCVGNEIVSSIQTGQTVSFDGWGNGSGIGWGILVASFQAAPPPTGFVKMIARKRTRFYSTPSTPATPRTFTYYISAEKIV